jgi:hypothetical protein
MLKAPFFLDFMQKTLYIIIITYGINCKTEAIMKTPSLFLIFFITLTFCACENPWMSEILESKTVTFDSNGGSSVPSQKLFKGERVQKPEAPEKSDSKFIGWYKDNETFEEPYDFDFVPLKNMTLYAKWVVDDTGGTPPDFDIDDIENLKELLNNLPTNTPDNPVSIKLKIENTTDLKKIKDILDGEKKYVKLDLYESKTITEIPDMAFSTISTSGSNDLYIYFGCNWLTSIILPESVTTINNGAFANCRNLTTIIIPDSVKEIISVAFFNCEKLTSVVIGKNVNNIGSDAFANCEKLTSVTFNGITNNIENSAFDGDLREQYYTGNPPIGTPGTYITSSPVSKTSTWTRKQQ